jgi:formate/nitrite transporter FocA (FNT family)
MTERRSPERHAHPPPRVPLLGKEEEQQVRRRAAPNAEVIHEVIRIFGEDELERPPEALVWSGLAAGLSMGFSLVAQGLLRTYLPDQPWTPLVYRLGYTVGFLIVILGRQQLFTENTITVVLPLLNRLTWSNLLRVLRLWGIVLGTNLVGNALFAWVLANLRVFSPATRAAFAVVSEAALVGGFGAVLIRAVFAGWLIALMVWLLPVADTEQVSIIVIITYLVGLGTLAHVIAGSVEVLYLVFTGATTAGTYTVGFLIPSLIGNVIGGVLLVAVLNYGQVVAGRAPE